MIVISYSKLLNSFLKKGDIMKVTIERRILSIATIFALLISLFAWTAATAPAVSAASPAPPPTAEPYTGQTAQGEYTIQTVAQLAKLANVVNDETSGTDYEGSYFYLIADINMANSDTYGSLSWVGGTPWTPIGLVDIAPDKITSSPTVVDGNGFAGIFDGGGSYNVGNHSISNMTMKVPQSGAGLFGYLAAPSTPTTDPDQFVPAVQNLNVSGYIADGASSFDAIGGVAGYNSGVINCVISSVTVDTPTSFNVGGIAGFNDSCYSENAWGAIVNCVNLGDITGANKAGGMAGENAGPISSCYNAGAITNPGSGKNGAAGIAGRNGNNNAAYEIGEITNCYNTGAISTSNGRWCGGIVGFENATSYVKNSYDSDTGTVSGYDDYAGIVGHDEGKVTENVYSYEYIDYEGDMPVRGTPETFAYMQTTNFLNDLTGGSTDGIWTSNGNEYPHLTYTADVPLPTGNIGQRNNYPVVYLGGPNASDSNDGDDPNAPLATLAKAVSVAERSTVALVYISMQDTISIPTAQTAFGNNMPVLWNPLSVAINAPMFDILPGGDLTVGGLIIDGHGSSIPLFLVERNGKLTVRNNTAINNGAVGIQVNGDATLILNRSSITTTANSVTLADSTSAMVMYTAPGQVISLSSAVLLNNGAYIEASSPLTAALPIDVANPSAVAGRTVLVPASDYALTNDDIRRVVYTGAGGWYAELSSGNAVLAQETGVFLDGVNGSDGNDGTVRTAPVQTLPKALEVQKDVGGDIYVLNPVTVSDAVDDSGAAVGGVTVKRSTTNISALFEVVGGGTLSLGNVTLDGNYAHNFSNTSTLVIVSGGEFNISGNAALQNNFANNGGAIAAASGTVNINGGSVSGNIAGVGGAVYVAAGSSVTVAGGVISGNTASGIGGAFYIAPNGALTVTGGTISGNTTTGMGSGIYVSTGNALTLDPASGTATFNLVDDVYVANGAAIAISSALTSTSTASPVTITVPSTPTGWITVAVGATTAIAQQSNGRIVSSQSYAKRVQTVNIQFNVI
jgi:hypothetical protein